MNSNNLKVIEMELITKICIGIVIFILYSLFLLIFGIKEGKKYYEDRYCLIPKYNYEHHKIMKELSMTNPSIKSKNKD